MWRILRFDRAGSLVTGADACYERRWRFRGRLDGGTVDAHYWCNTDREGGHGVLHLRRTGATFAGKYVESKTVARNSRTQTLSVVYEENALEWVSLTSQHGHDLIACLENFSDRKDWAMRFGAKRALAQPRKHERKVQDVNQRLAFAAAFNDCLPALALQAALRQQQDTPTPPSNK